MHTLQKFIIFTKKIGAITISNAHAVLIATASIPLLKQYLFSINKKYQKNSRFNLISFSAQKA